jgi:hypothetical protein
MPNTSYIQLEENHNLRVPVLSGTWSLRIQQTVCQQLRKQLPLHQSIIFFLMKFVGCYMLQFAYDMSRSQSTACHIQGLAEYVDNVILFQLCLLVIQRLALTISPLKVHLLMTRKHVMGFYQHLQ